MKLKGTFFFALFFVLWIAQNALSQADSGLTIHEPMGYWDWIIVPRVSFEKFPVGACLDFAKYKCNGEYKPPGAKPVIFEYHYDPKKALQPVTLDLNDVTVPDLLREICEPYNIAIEEKPDRIIFTDRKESQ